MKKAGKICLAVSAVCALPIYMMASARPGKKQWEQFRHRNFAHRGLHTEDKTVPENSLAAFRRAAAHGYGIELDVQLSKDGQVVVFHDEKLERVCGREGYVGDYTLEELQQMSLCGTEETIPLFSEVLQSIEGAGPLIVELKTTKKRRELCEKTYELLKTYRGIFCIESFDPFIVQWFRNHAPEIFRGQLAEQPETYEDIPAWQKYMLGYCMFNFLARPQFIAYRIGKRPLPIRLMRAFGTPVFGWTPHDEAEIADNDGMIFEFYEPELRY